MIEYRIKDYELESLKPLISAVVDRLDNEKELEDLTIELKTKKVMNSSDYFFDEYIKENQEDYKMSEMLESFKEYYESISYDVFYEAYINSINQLNYDKEIDEKHEIRKLSNSEIQALDDGLFTTFNGVTDFHPVTERATEFCAASRNIHRVNIHDNMKVIQSCAFQDNPNLRDVLFPASILMTENRSFVSCNIHTIIAEGKPFFIDDGTFYNNSVEKFFVKPEYLNEWKEYLESNPKLLETFKEKNVDKLVESYTSLHYIYQIPTLTQYLQMENRVKEFNTRIAPFVSDLYNNVKNEKTTQNMTRGAILDDILKGVEDEYDRYMRYDYPKLEVKPDIVSSFIERIEEKSASIYAEVVNYIEKDNNNFLNVMTEKEIDNLTEIRNNAFDFDVYEEEEELDEGLEI